MCVGGGGVLPVIGQCDIHVDSVCVGGGGGGGGGTTGNRAV